jgi:protocatechuate 3,4-dioxygenase beta subunit
MRDFDEHNITESVVDRFGDTPDPRLKTVMTSLVKHLHDFVRDVDLSFDEWRAAIDFLTRTGQKCSQTRQEFILLSDTLGVSMLVDAVNHRQRGGATETTVLGPFFVAAAPRMPLGANISGAAKGEPLQVSGTVSDADGKPIASANVEVWQSDSEGFYDVQVSPALNLRAGFETDEQGRLYFSTILPKFYPIPYDGPVGEMLQATKRHPYRPAHVHFMIGAQGFETLVTHVFVDGDRYLDSDAVFGVKSSLIRELVAHPADDRRGPWYSLSYDFRLKKT